MATDQYCYCAVAARVLYWLFTTRGKNLMRSVTRWPPCSRTCAAKIWFLDSLPHMFCVC